MAVYDIAETREQVAALHGATGRSLFPRCPSRTASTREGIFAARGGFTIARPKVGRTAVEMGQKATSNRVALMSVLPPKADVNPALLDIAKCQRATSSCSLPASYAIVYRELPAGTCQGSVNFQGSDFAFGGERYAVNFDIEVSAIRIAEGGASAWSIIVKLPRRHFTHLAAGRCQRPRFNVQFRRRSTIRTIVALVWNSET